MDSLGNNIQYRSVPLIQRGAMTRYQDRGAREDGATRPSRLRLVEDDSPESETEWDASWSEASEDDNTRSTAPRERDNRRSLRRRRSVRIHDDDFTDGSSYAASQGEGITWEARSAVFTEDDFYATRGLPGSRRRREAVSAGLRSIPEAFVSLVELATSHARGTLAIGLVFLVVFMLYTPARNLYVTNRKLDALQATYDALLVENDAIRDELELLQTREGIENEARSRGYVDEGETKVVVEGISDQGEAAHQGAAAEVLADVEVDSQSPWYLRVLDALFGYEAEG